MDNAARGSAPSTDRTGRSGSDLARFEVRGLDADRALIRTFARRLAEGGPEAARLRDAVTGVVARDASHPPRKGGILAALRASPLVGSGIDLSRPRVEPRDVDL